MVGPKESAIELKNNLTIYLREKLNLTLSPEKTKITNLSWDRAKFLGVYF